MIPHVLDPKASGTLQSTCSPQAGGSAIVQPPGSRTPEERAQAAIFLQRLQSSKYIQIPTLGWRVEVCASGQGNACRRVALAEAGKTVNKSVTSPSRTPLGRRDCQPSPHCSTQIEQGGRCFFLAPKPPACSIHIPVSNLCSSCFVGCPFIIYFSPFFASQVCTRSSL